MKKALSVLAVIALVVSLFSGAFTITTNAASSTVLDVIWSDIHSVGHQTPYSNSCACFAVAYCRTMLDGRVRYWYEFDSSGGNNGESGASASWGKGSYYTAAKSSVQGTLKAIYDQINAGRPAILHVTGGRAASGQHWVAVVGYENVTDVDNFSYNSFLIIDPAAKTYGLENLGGLGYTLKFTSGTGYRYAYTKTGSVQSGPHTHSYTNYIYFTKSHPHYKCYECSCGDVAQNYDEPTFYDQCDECKFDLEPGTYYFKNKGTGTYLDVHEWADKNGQELWSVDFPEAIAFETDGSAASGYTLRPLFSSTRILDSRDEFVVAGSNACIWEVNGNSSQQWRFCKENAGYVIYNGQNYGCALDSTTAGHVYIEKRYETSPRQYWSIQNAVQYDANGGTGAPFTQFKEYGEGLKLSSVKPTRSGYTFVGWSTSASATTAQYQAGGTYSANKNVTLYAVWKKATALKITSQPKTAYAKMGSTVQTSVKATGDGLKYTWYVCDADEEVWYKSSITSATYAIKMTTLKSDRKVYCVVTDKYGNEEKSNTVRLRAKAAITAQPKTAYAKVGTKAKTTVTATGDGLKYTWYVKDVGGSKYTKSSITSSTYSVSMTTAKSDRRAYCVVSDKYGNKVQTNTVLLRTKAAITAQPKTAYAKIGAKATVSVKATGNGLRYVWYIKDAGNSKYTKSSITSSTYSVKMSSKVNGRKLICYVYDKYGNKVQSNTVMLKKK